MTLPLPDPHEVFELWGQNLNVYTDDQMHAYAADAVAEERERCAEIAEGFDACDPRHIAAAIRAQEK